MQGGAATALTQARHLGRAAQPDFLSPDVLWIMFKI